MPSTFQQFFNRGPRSLSDRAFGISVTITSNGKTSDSFTATYREEDYESVEFETGLAVKRQMKDFYFAKSDCVIEGVTVEPASGMIVMAESVEYEIIPLPGSATLLGRPAVEEYANYQWLCHTQEVTR